MFLFFMIISCLLIIFFFPAKENFKYGHRFYCFNLVDTENAENILLSGHMKLVVELKEKVTKPHNVLVYGFSRDSFDIDHEGKCRITNIVL